MASSSLSYRCFCYDLRASDVFANGYVGELVVDVVCCVTTCVTACLTASVVGFSCWKYIRFDLVVLVEPFVSLIVCVVAIDGSLFSHEIVSENSLARVLVWL